MTPIIERLGQMFSAKNPYINTPLQDFLFDRIIQIVEEPEDINWDASAESKLAKDFIDECYAYLTVTRIKSEHQVMFKNTKASKHDLDRSDVFYMKGIIDHRNFIFTNH